MHLIINRQQVETSALKTVCGDHAGKSSAITTRHPMSSKTLSDPIHVERNPLGDFTFYPDYVVAEWLNPEIDSFDLVKMETVAKSVYGENVWGYISNRTHATVSNPVAVYQMLQLKYAPQAVAIVTYSMRSHIVAKLEKEHCKAVPLEIFTQLQEAQKWMQSQTTALKEEDSKVLDSERLA